LASAAAGRLGRATNSPPQFGQRPARTFSAQAAQNVHSKEQMRASVASGGRSLSQHSQPGRNCSMKKTPRERNEQPGFLSLEAGEGQATEGNTGSRQ
jgi:hypothetical protein